MNRQFLWALVGAICGWLTICIFNLLYKHFKKRKKRPLKEKIGLLIGNPGSGAEEYYGRYQWYYRFGKVGFFPNVYTALKQLFPDESSNWTLLNRFDSVIIFGCISGSDVKLMRDFLFNNVIKCNSSLAAYLPTEQEYDFRYALLFEKKKQVRHEIWHWRASVIDAAVLIRDGRIVKVK